MQKTNIRKTIMRYILLLMPALLQASCQTTQLPDKKEIVSHQETSESRKKTITLKNSITPEMLTCSHWTGNHKPESFSLIVDGTPLKEGETKELSSDKNEVEINYQYSFAKGLYKGSRTCKVQVPTNATIHSLAFSWKKEPRVWIETER